MKKAFSLIEILVVSVIVGIIGIGVVSVLASTNKITFESARKVMLNSNVHRLMTDIGRDLKSFRMQTFKKSKKRTVYGLVTPLNPYKEL